MINLDAYAPHFELLVADAIVLMQEVRDWPIAADLSGYVLHHTADCPCAILVPICIDVVVNSNSIFANETAFGVLLGEVAAVSFYLPNAWRPDEEYTEGLRVLTFTIDSMFKAGAKLAVVGGDSQISLPGGVGGITGPSVWLSTSRATAGWQCNVLQLRPLSAI